MKIIAKVRTEVFLCEVNNSEIEKYMGLYYGKMEPLKVGDEVDLGKGHDFARKVQDAFLTTEKMIKDNASVLRAITDGVTLCAMDNKKRAEYNLCAYQELQMIDETQVSPEAWDSIKNAMEFLK